MHQAYISGALSSNTTEVNPQGGFTLVELLVVISIIGLLASIALASLNSARAKARDARRMADITALRNALALYYDGTNGSYPLLGTGAPFCGNFPDGSQFCLVVSRSISTPGYPHYRSWSDFEQAIQAYIPGGIKDPVNSETGSRYLYGMYVDQTGTRPRPVYYHMTNCTASGNPQPGSVPVTASIFAFPLERLPVTVGDFFQYVKNCPGFNPDTLAIFGFFIP